MVDLNFQFSVSYKNTRKTILFVNKIELNWLKVSFVARGKVLMTFYRYNEIRLNQSQIEFGVNVRN